MVQKKQCKKMRISSLTYSNKSSVINSLEIISNLKRYYNILYDPKQLEDFCLLHRIIKLLRNFENNVLIKLEKYRMNIVK